MGIGKAPLIGAADTDMTLVKKNHSGGKYLWYFLALHYIKKSNITLAPFFDRICLENLDGYSISRN